MKILDIIPAKAVSYNFPLFNKITFHQPYKIKRPPHVGMGVIYLAEDSLLEYYSGHMIFRRNKIFLF